MIRDIHQRNRERKLRKKELQEADLFGEEIESSSEEEIPPEKPEHKYPTPDFGLMPNIFPKIPRSERRRMPKLPLRDFDSMAHRDYYI